MSIVLTGKIFTIVIIIWLLSLGRSIVIMIGGSKIFRKANKSEKTALIPILNLFTMLEVAEINTFFGILLFIPFVNLFVLMYMSIKLGRQFKVGGLFKLGLVCLPFIFYPALAFSDKQYKLQDEEYFRALDSARGESINLMTEEEIKEINTEVPEEETEQIDSIFKDQFQIMEKVEPYKAAKIDNEVLEKLKNSTPEEDMFKKIDAVSEEDMNKLKIEEENKPTSMFTTELEKEDEVEYIDL